MTIGNTPPAVEKSELLSRFIYAPKWIRPDKSVKSDAFIPRKPKPPETQFSVSVTRQLGITEAVLWKIGLEIVPSYHSKTLYGRADFKAEIAQNKSLHLIPTAIPKNHINMVNWPEEDKNSRMSIAQDIALASKYFPFKTQ